MRMSNESIHSQILSSKTYTSFVVLFVHVQFNVGFDFFALEYWRFYLLYKLHAHCEQFEYSEWKNLRDDSLKRKTVSLFCSK